MPAVLIISKATNQPFDPKRAAFHSAKPFQIIDQTATSANKGPKLNPNPVIPHPICSYHID